MHKAILAITDAFPMTWKSFSQRLHLLYRALRQKLLQALVFGHKVLSLSFRGKGASVCGTGRSIFSKHLAA
ncbi:MAG: hypothetical protein P4L10_12120, partial [Acidobacteriaceae bacterium]|nr:hypothetical protein [Acidobacteriaceae bacterium]